jgi:[protein-PII] uridylyltransferase
MTTNLAKLSERLSELRHNFRRTCRDDVPGILAARTYAQAFLGAFHEAFAGEAFPPEDWAVVAVGGFGRGDLSFLSDLDLLFLHRRRMPPFLKGAIRDVTYSLWDAGFEVGHVTASLSAVERLVREDFSVLTTYLETRWIAGDESFYRRWREDFLGSFSSARQRRFAKDLVAYRQQRLQQFGESSYLLEPHLKEGVGGLRDVHAILWTAAVLFRRSAFDVLAGDGLLTAEERHWLEQAYDFLWRVRLQLHQLSGKRQDQLLFPEQEQVAERLGFLDGVQGKAVEAFMRLYYRHTARIRRSASFLLERLVERQNRSPGLMTRLRRRILPGPFLLEGHHLHFLEPDLVVKDPRLLMQFFWQATRSKAHFHHQTGQVIRQNLALFTDFERRDGQVVQQFFDILLHPQQAFPVLKVMLETGFLQAFLPELDGVRYRVQHDVYHLYTVDEHLLRAVMELHHMEQQPEESIIRLGLEEAFAQLENRRILYLAALIHDIGKGQGKNHAVVGAEMSRGIALRLNLNEREAELLGYLVENHLILAETALKRDLTDEKPILHCATTIADRERLRLLYLLTIADSCATGPGAWNTWKASLVRELYVKVDNVLLSGHWEGEDIKRRSQEVQRALMALAANEERAAVARWCDQLSVRYLLSQSPQTMMSHYRLEERLASAAVVLEAEQAAGEMWQVTLAARDRPGLFSIITGVLWAYGLNILSADLFTRPSKVALDVLLLERVLDSLHTRELWNRISSDLVTILSGDSSHLDRLLEARCRSSVLQQRKTLPRREDRVIINEEASDFYTVLEVYTWDRPGLLHVISTTLFKQGVSIQLAKISTPGAQVADVFYVTDVYGNKLLDPLLHTRLRERLLESLARHQ